MRGCEISGDEERCERDNLFRLSNFTKTIPCHLMWFMRVLVHRCDAELAPLDLWSHQ